MARHDGSGGPTGDFRVRLRELAEADEDEFLKMAQASAGLHHPWYSAATTPEEFGAYLTRLSRPGTEGRVVCVRDGGAMAGLVTLDTIVRGRFQSASISYGAFAPAAGRGFMAEGVRLTLWYAFQELRLHRVEASIQPGNQASLRLIQRLGFRQEGYSPDMLFIDGAWRDHVRWAITREMTGFPAVDPHPTLPER